jgi:hypothetical protein
MAAMLMSGRAYTYNVDHSKNKKNYGKNFFNFLDHMAKAEEQFMTFST